jgi:CheY-like chemotaxis protein
MKLLIVEDDPSLAEVTAELLKTVDRPAKRLEAITLAADLQTAIRSLPEHGAVLCDGMFPLAPGSPFVADDWDVVRQEAIRRGIHFVLYGGSIRALECARASMTPTIIKPAAVEGIYAALTRPRLPSPSKNDALPAQIPVEANLVAKTVTGTLDEYCRELETEADVVAHQAELDARSGHLHAFNFGRVLGRMEQSREQMWLRVRWLLFGAAAGVAIAIILLHAFLGPLVAPMVR